MTDTDLDPIFCETSQKVVIRMYRKGVFRYVSQSLDIRVIDRYKNCQEISKICPKSILKHQPASFKAEVDFKLTFTKDRVYW